MIWRCAEGGQFLDYSVIPQGFLDSFLSGKSKLAGLTGVEITDPDGNAYNVGTDALGQFTLQPFSLKAGDNFFTARATFEDQSCSTTRLTLRGIGGAAVWLLLAALGALGGRRRLWG